MILLKHVIDIAAFVVISHTCLSQVTVSNGDRLKQEGDLEAAIAAYKESFVKAPKDSINTYSLACAFALTYQKDSAFYYLNIALKSNHSLRPLTDSDLYALIDDDRWEDIENKQFEKFQEYNGKLAQPEYAKKLLQVIIKDQALDYYIKQARRFYVSEKYVPHWYYPLGELKQQLVSNNFKEIQHLINTYGWPKYSIVGSLAADAPLLCINHHENDSIRKKYIDRIKNSCLKGEGSCTEFAKIQDRILVNDGKLQLYGMQFRYRQDKTLEPFPIKDPEFVDKRRKTIGLEPLKDYLKRKINYDFDVEQKKSAD
ncbi:DUF6624 domain-containing protein [Hanstruepera ponticola]|uniref:DUF6624 domain-containing protein n=1 Tax=Hanstruepera ponticola TaxID=2042995 RepID=UPI0017870452|nr:DUF6624 domain-containing protein [Hanstruepera ponticola]